MSTLKLAGQFIAFIVVIGFLKFTLSLGQRSRAVRRAPAELRRDYLELWGRHDV